MSDQPIYFAELKKRESMLEAQLAATHAAIRALPRHQRYLTPGGGLGDFVLWADVARLLGDPAVTEEGVSDQPAKCPHCHEGVNSPERGGTERCFHCDRCAYVACMWTRAEKQEMAAQLAATHAAIRALPRTQWPAIFLETDYVLWSDVARLLGDPAQEQPKERTSEQVTHAADFTID